MCVLCQSFQPWAEDCAFALSGAGTLAEPEVAAPTQVYSYDQIADQLTGGYWSSVGSGPRSFDVSAGGTLYIDITQLTANGQTTARQALDAWSLVTGITFVEVTAWTPPSSTWTEGADAAPDSTTAYSMAVGDDFEGTLSSTTDRDAVAVFLTVGQSVTVTLSGDGSGGNALVDPFLRLLDASGNIIAWNDDATGLDSALTYQAVSSGTYYIQAGSFNDNYAGDYTISAREAAQTVDIVFDDESSGAYSSSSVIGSTIQSSFVNIDPNWAGGGTRTDSYYFQTYMHEIGHALGLGHAGNYNGSANYSTDALYLNDSWQASLMSYFHQTENTWLEASFAYAITPMMADIIAIQSLYGTPEANSGNTVYGEGGNSGTYLDGAINLSNPVTYTVFDTGGIDTFDFSSQSAHQRLDLREETYSDLLGLRGNVGISRGTVIENGVTGGGNDTLTGNGTGNGLSAGSGNDTVDGLGGNDAIRGEAGADTLSGGSGSDLIAGGSGNNLIDGGLDGDLLVGDEVTLDMLQLIYPEWMPPADAQMLLDAGDLIALWDDIVAEMGIA